MSERPINFKVHEVRAIFEGRKTMARRIVKPQPTWALSGTSVAYANKRNDLHVRMTCPFGKPGDVLWVREPWFDNGGAFCYRADYSEEIARGVSWHPLTHMPRRASRIDLRIKTIRVERLQDITEADCYLEGIPTWQSPEHDFSPVLRFKALWQSLHGKGSWESNPWVWVVKFERALN